MSEAGPPIFRAAALLALTLLVANAAGCGPTAYQTPADLRNQIKIAHDACQNGDQDACEHEAYLKSRYSYELQREQKCLNAGYVRGYCMD